MEISRKEVRDVLIDIVTNEVEDMLHFKRIRKRLTEKRYKNLVRLYVEHEITLGGEMEMYNKYKKLQFPNELIWFNTNTQNYYSASGIINELIELYPNRTEVLNVVKDASVFLDMPSTYMVASQRLEKLN